MTHPSKAKGSKFERDFMYYMRGAGYQAERLVLAGANDEGDVLVMDGPTPIVCELKAENKIDLPGYLRELEREHLAYARARGLDPSEVGKLLVVKRRMYGTGGAYTVSTVDEHFGIR